MLPSRAPRAPIACLLALGLVALLVSCVPASPRAVDAPLATTPLASPIAEAEPPSPSPTPSSSATPTLTPTATWTPTNTATATQTPTPTLTPTATPAARAVSMVIEYGGKSYSRPILAAEAASLVTYAPTGELQPNANAIKALVDAFAKQHERPARNSTFRWDNVRGAPVAIADSQVGVEVDKAETTTRLTQALIGASPDVFPAAYRLIEPTYSATKPPVVGKAVLASVAHNYNKGEPSGKNQEIGVRYLDGAIVLPGEIFSNDSLVYRQGASVYNESVVNQGDRNVLAPGGGLCSLATIGFQAAFISGMEIVERHPHLYWITSYVLTYRGVTYRGLDATTGNMRWRNTTGYPVRVRAWADGAQSHVQIVGTSPGWQITVASYADTKFIPAPTAVEVFTDPKKPVGFTEVIRDPHDGRDVSVVREVRKGTTLVRRDRFTSHYEAVGKQILLGPAR